MAVDRILADEKHKSGLSTAALFKLLRRISRHLRKATLPILEAELIEDTQSAWTSIRSIDRSDGTKVWVHRKYTDPPRVFPKFTDSGIEARIKKHGGSETIRTGVQFFLSYRHTDVALALHLREMLHTRGFASWIAHAENVRDEDPSYLVPRFLEKQQAYLLYLTRRCLSSGWILYEYRLNEQEAQLPTLIVLDGNDRALLEFLAFASVNLDRPQVLRNKLAATLERRVSERWFDRLMPMVAGLLRPQRDDIAITTYPFSESTPTDQRQTLRIQPFDAALAVVAERVRTNA